MMISLVSLATSASVLVKIFLLLLCTQIGQIFSQVPDVVMATQEPLPFHSASQVQRFEPDPDSSRLSDLLLLQDLLLHDMPGYDGSESGRIANLLPSGDTSDLAKRVFCNGFTGCGGRFRGRRRQQPPVAEIGKRLLPNLKKRPFCNTYGCFNSGKKRFGPGLVAGGGAPAAPSEQMLGDKIKKLFCNSYGGCQNLGKRLALLDGPDVRQMTSGQRPNPVAEALWYKLASMKRFFSSDFDEAMDRLINSGR